MDALLAKVSVIAPRVCDEGGLTLTGEENPCNVSSGHRQVSTPTRNDKCCGLTRLRTWARDDTNQSRSQGNYVQTKTWFTLCEMQNMFTKWSPFRETVIANSTVSYFCTSYTDYTKHFILIFWLTHPSSSINGHQITKYKSTQLWNLEILLLLMQHHISILVTPWY
jgi:hypothetical protein